MLIILLFSCVVTFLTLGFAFMFGTDYANTTTLYWSNTTAIVANSSRAFSLQVVQDASFPGDNANEIDLYRVKSKCSELETSTDNYIEVGSDLTFINVTTTYAWMGSSITFHICGSTNQSIPFQRRLDAVIVKGLDDLQFTETFLYNFYKGLYFFPGVDGEWMCTNEMVQINDPDYYTIIFLPQSTADSFNYSVTYNIQSVDLAQLQDSITATLHKDQDKWDVPGPPLFETDICVIGTLKNRYTYDTLAKSRVHIRTHYASDATPRLGAIFLIIASLLGLLGTTLIISVVVLYKCCWKKSVSFK